MYHRCVLSVQFCLVPSCNKLSDSPFALGCSGLKIYRTVWRSRVRFFFFSILCVANICLSLSHVTLHDVDVVCLTTKIRLLSLPSNMVYLWYVLLIPQVIFFHYFYDILKNKITCNRICYTFHHYSVFIAD